MAFLDGIGLAELWKLIKAEDNKLATAIENGPKIAAGTYTGTGGTQGGSQTINVGFTPDLVVVWDAPRSAGIYSMSNASTSFAATPNNNGYFYGEILRITDGGFVATSQYESINGGEPRAFGLNQSNQNYNYLAVKVAG